MREGGGSRAADGGADASPYGVIAHLMASGASIEEIDGYLEGMSRGADEERRSARWLADWYAFEHRDRPALSSPDYLGRGPAPG